MVSVLASSPVDRGFEPRLGQIKDCKIGICCFSTKHTALRGKSKDWFIRQRQLRNMFGQATASTNVFQSRQVSA
jgi:hypothetical protein